MTTYQVDENGIIDENSGLDFEEQMVRMRCWNSALINANIKGNTAKVEDIYEAIYQTEKYNERRNELTDTLIDYNDEIESIECLEVEEEMYDISVAGDQLFYANGILTKNSIALVATVDFMLAVIETEELAEQGVQLFKQLKSRYGDKNKWNKFTMKVKKGNQRWVELDQDSNAANDFSKSHKAEPKQERIKEEPKSARAKIDDLVIDCKF